MRPLPILTALIACTSAAVSAWGTQVTSADEIGRKAVNAVTIDFHELKGKDKQVFGSAEIGQPYSALGLVLPSQMISSPDKGPSGKVTIESTGISRINNASYQSLAFTRPQKIVGFTVCSPKATSVIVTALDKNGRTLDEAVLPDAREPRYVGFIQKNAEITVIRVVAPHASAIDADSAPTTVTGVTFTAAGEGDGTSSPSEESSLLGGDYGQARAVEAPGAGAGALAYNGGGGGDAGVGGSGSAGNNAFGRNPGNRNPNLPPTTIPEPVACGLLSAGVIAALRRRPGRG